MHPSTGPPHISAICRLSAGNFPYAHVKRPLYFGYGFIPFSPRFNPGGDRQIRIADAEKALLDYFYLHSSCDSEDRIRELRLDMDIVREDVDREKLDRYLDRFRCRALEKRIACFKGVCHG